MSEDFEFHSQVVMRTPVLPLNTKIDEASIISYLQQPFFSEALYLASESLYYKGLKLLNGEIQDPKEKEKTVLAMANYLNRMSSRCTPFGLFAGCSVLNWDNTDEIEFDQSAFERHTRLDMQYLCSMAKSLSELDVIRDKIIYYPNSTLYKIGNELRYVENIIDKEENLHQISSVTSSPLIESILDVSKKGMTIPQICDFILEDEANKEDAIQFIHDLIQAQLLISEIEPRVTGDEFVFHILKVLERIQQETQSAEIGNIVHTLQGIVDEIRQLDIHKTNDLHHYIKIKKGLHQLNLNTNQKSFFQTDFVRSEIKGGLNKKYQGYLKDAIYVLGLLSDTQRIKHLENFKSEFYKRYENQELPLNTVLDTEIGIGYTDVGKDGDNPLVDDLALSEPVNHQKSIVRNKSDQFLYGKIREAEITNQHIVNIQPQDLEIFSEVEQPLSPSVSAMFRVIDKDRIFVESIAGSSAVNLLARFAHSDQKIDRIVKDVASTEQNKNPEVIFAEIVHLPQDRVGNILQRPALHQYEIPYLAQSSVDKEYQIPVQDLMVSVRNNEIVLKSKRLNKIVIPRLSTAHNYTYLSMPVYRFLCDLQFQNQQIGLNIDWDPERFECKYLPRLTYKNSILALQTWVFDKSDFKELVEKGIDHFYQFWQEWQLPPCFMLTQGDRELLIDLKKPLTIDSFLSSIKKLTKITLKEYPFTSGQSVAKNNQGKYHANQFVSLLVKNRKSYIEPEHALLSYESVKRDFSPGTEWVYFKIYCGVKSTDKILLEAVKPLSELLLKEGLIDRWFFIRYADPDYHVRIRFHLGQFSSATLGQVTHMVLEHLAPYKDSHHFWKIQLDTYQRELERYGEHNIVRSEQIFFYDSINILSALERLQEDSYENPRWLWGIKIADYLLDTFKIPFEQKFEIISDLNISFSNEFNMDKKLKLQIDSKYRHHQPRLKQVLDSKHDEYLQTEVFIAHDHLSNIATELHESYKNETGIHINDLMKSYLHMSINRMMPAKQRLYELLIYNFLWRHYKSQIAMAAV